MFWFMDAEKLYVFLVCEQKWQQQENYKSEEEETIKKTPSNNRERHGIYIIIF